MLHDVGKSKVPEHILNKPGRFTDEEFAIMKLHPIHGRNLLASLPQSDHAAIDIAYAHHERIDGKGYPRGLLPHQIPYFAKIIALTDTYDAITSSRCYDKGRASMNALDIIYQNKGSQFDEDLAIEFIKCIGIYPPGSIVELNTGHMGIVIAENAKSKLKPRIIIVMGPNKKWTNERIVDLGKGSENTQAPQLAITREVPNGTHGIDINTFIKKGLKLKLSK